MAFLKFSAGDTWYPHTPTSYRAPLPDPRLGNSRAVSLFRTFRRLYLEKVDPRRRKRLLEDGTFTDPGGQTCTWQEQTEICCTEVGLPACIDYVLVAKALSQVIVALRRPTHLRSRDIDRIFKLGPGSYVNSRSDVKWCDRRPARLQGMYAIRIPMINDVYCHNYSGYVCILAHSCWLYRHHCTA